ncbi:MAG: hydroxyphenylacetyl-CoA thioesterase PaaI [Candidatus Nezhaarchaeota archaeon]|nr:hydroxyphenylacetyl-CoA thioesterase PaaI [Candidatus Nezhaarchaeota archaeon]
MSDELRNRLLKVFRQDPYAKFLGIELLEVRDGYSKAALTVQDFMLNFHGVAHGGLIASLADAAFAAASNSHNKKAVALSLNINYRKPARVGDVLIAEAFEESLGKITATYRIAVKNSEDNLVAVGQGLVYRMEESIL